MTAASAVPPGGRLRVAMISFQLGEYCIRLANALSAHCETSLFLPNSVLRCDAVAIAPAVRLRAFEDPRLREPVPQLRLVRAILRAIERLDPDVVHLQQAHVWLNPFLPAIARRRPLVVTVHDPRHHSGDASSRKTPQWLVYFGFRRATRLIVHGESLRDEVVAVCGVPIDRIDVVPLHRLGGAEGVGAQPPPPAGRPPSVLFFGRIWPYKGLEYLIRAQPSISERVPEARFVIAGEGEDMGRYRAMMADESRFILHNEFVPMEVRARLFDEASLVVLPYVEATQSGVIPVAYAHGRPVVTTAVGALAEAVQDGVTGLVVSPRDEAALADAVVRLLEDPALRERMGEAARRMALEGISAEVAAEATLEVYRASIRS